MVTEISQFQNGKEGGYALEFKHRSKPKNCLIDCIVCFCCCPMEEKMIQDNMEQEIECPCCYDIMALSSNFDRLCYLCQECNLSLLIN